MSQRIGGKQVSVQLPEELLQEVDRISDEQRMTRARTLRILLVVGVLSDWKDQGCLLDGSDEELGALFERMKGDRE